MFYAVKSWGWRRLLLVAGLTFGAALFAFVTSLEDGQGERVALRWLQFAPVSPVISDAELEWVELSVDSEAVPVSRPGSEEPPQELRRGLFETYKIERERSRSAQLETLRALLDESSGTARRSEFEDELLQLLRRMDLESRVEGMLRAQSGRDAVVVLSEGGANVIVAGVLDRSEAARIGDWVSAAAGVPKERIQIADDLTP